MERLGLFPYRLPLTKAPCAASMANNNATSFLF